jgi:hypothetical protein
MDRTRERRTRSEQREKERRRKGKKSAAPISSLPSHPPPDSAYAAYSNLHTFWGGTLVMFIARYLVGVRKRRKTRPRWEKTEREGNVDDDDDEVDDDDVVDDGSDAVGQARGKKESKGKEEREGRRPRKHQTTPHPA